MVIIAGETRKDCDKMLERPLAKKQLLVRSDGYFQRYEISHPLGDDFSGLDDFIPTFE